MILICKSLKIGLKEAVSIGIGGMVGGGIFAVLGLAVDMAKGGTTLAGLKALTETGFEASIVAGVHAATERSREIAAES